MYGGKILCAGIVDIVLKDNCSRKKEKSGITGQTGPGIVVAAVIAGVTASLPGQTGPI